MGNQYFVFKQFKIDQHDCAMKVGTDGVLLGSWCDITNDNRILDIGAGTGLISLMIAQRNQNAIIDAVEIDESAGRNAERNFSASPWSDRLNLYHTSLQDFNPEIKYNHIVSNPPYFDNSLKNTDSRKTQARHTDTLSYETLISKSFTLLDTKGRLSLILPVNTENKVEAIVQKENLVILRKITVYGNIGGKAIRYLFEIGRKEDFKTSECITEDFIIEISRHNYTDQYIDLTKDFYLKM